MNANGCMDCKPCPREPKLFAGANSYWKKGFIISHLTCRFKFDYPYLST